MTGPLVKNAADSKQVAAARDKEKDRRSLELADFGMLMSTEWGRRFMLRMLDMTGFQRTSFTGNSTTFFNEGRRSIGLELWADVNEYPDLYLQMITEARQKERKENG